jgi:hypothetical protein
VVEKEERCSLLCPVDLRQSSGLVEAEEAEVTRLVTRRLRPTLSSRLVTKFWVSGRERRGSGGHLVSRYKVARYYCMFRHPVRKIWICRYSIMSGDTICTTDYPPCSTCRYYNRILLCSLWRYSKRLCCVLCSNLLCLAILEPTLRSTLPVDITTDYPLCSL